MAKEPARSNFFAEWSVKAMGFDPILSATIPKRSFFGWFCPCLGNNSGNFESGVFGYKSGV